MPRNEKDPERWMRKWEVDEKGETSFYPKDDFSGKENSFEGYSAKKKAMILRARRRIRLKASERELHRRSYGEEEPIEGERKPMRIKLDNQDHDDGMVLVIAENSAEARDDYTIMGTRWEFDNADFAYALIDDDYDLVNRLVGLGYEVDDSDYVAPEEIKTAQKRRLPIYLDNRKSEDGTVILRAPASLVGQEIYGVKWGYDDNGEWAEAVIEDQYDLIDDLEDQGFDVHSDNYWPTKDTNEFRRGGRSMVQRRAAEDGEETWEYETDEGRAGQYRKLRPNETGRPGAGALGVFLNTPDDMQWLREVHLPDLDPKFQSAQLYGNEDSPGEIDCFESADPRYDDEPEVWVPVEQGEEEEE